MSSTCFEPESSSSGRRLYKQLWYSAFDVRQYKQFCRWKNVMEAFKTGACVTHCTITAYTTVFLKMKPQVRDK
jgi:hypothetical protein